MQENELMIGDWVYLAEQNVNARVTELRSDGYDALVVTDHGEVDMMIDMRPIPLTEDILLKNGFTHYGEDVFPNQYLLNVGVGEETYVSVTFTHHNHRVKVDIYTYYPKQEVVFSKQYMSVHELQHAMRMCGIEKEIEL